MDTYENSRVSYLNREILEGIVSCDIEDTTAAVEALPDALTPQEISDVGQQLSILESPDENKPSRALKRKGIYNLGSIALSEKVDLVTAESAVLSLRQQGIMAKLSYILLKNDIRSTKKKIIKTITS